MFVFDVPTVNPLEVLYRKVLSALIVVELTDVITLLLPTFVYEVIPALFPSTPLVPEFPLLPLLPSLPSFPSTPEVPEVPELPLFPSLPFTPDVPDVPDVPELPLFPLFPFTPLVPDVPEVPDEPSSAAATFVPKFPEESITKTLLSVLLLNPVSWRVFNFASDPLTINFFQFGILMSLLWLVTQ